MAFSFEGQQLYHYVNPKRYVMPICKYRKEFSLNPSMKTRVKPCGCVDMGKKVEKPDESGWVEYITVRFIYHHYLCELCWNRFYRVQQKKKTVPQPQQLPKRKISQTQSEPVPKWIPTKCRKVKSNIPKSMPTMVTRSRGKLENKK